MKYGSWGASLRCRNVVFVCVVVLSVVAVTKFPSAARTSARMTALDLDPTPQQDVIRLETRVNQLEQRLYSMETNLRTLEQQSRLASVTSRDAGHPEVILLRAEVQRLQQRLADDECALAKLDERTLSPSMREARRKSGARPDGCRANADAPLRLPEPR